jgi:hypothetical protein
MMLGECWRTRNGVGYTCIAARREVRRLSQGHESMVLPLEKMTKSLVVGRGLLDQSDCTVESWSV